MTKTDQGKERLDVPAARNTTLSQGVFGLAKSAIGAGTLSIPSHFGNLGLLSGTSILVFASAVCTCTLHFLSRIAANTDLSSYFAMGKLAFGTLGEVSAMLALVLNILGALIYYLVTSAGFLKDFICFIRPELGGYWIAKEQYLIILIAALTFPLACLRDMSTLGKASLAGMICMGYILLLSIVDFFLDSATRATVSHPMLTSVTPSVFCSVFSLLIFAFVNHFTMIAVVPSMVDPTPKRRSTLLATSSSFILAFYLLIGLFGFSHFGESIKGVSILDAGVSTSKISVWMYNVGKIMMAAVLVLSYPLLLDPCRGALDGALSLAFGNMKGWKSMAGTRSLVLTVFLVLVSLGIGMTCPGQALDLLSACSAFTGSLIVFIFPAAYFLKLSGRYKVQAWERGAAYFILAFGVVFMFVGTYYSVAELVTKLMAKGTA